MEAGIMHTYVFVNMGEDPPVVRNILYQFLPTFYSHFKNDKTKCSQEIIFFEIAFRACGHYISSSCQIF